MECNVTTIDWINVICNILMTIFTGIGLGAIIIGYMEYSHNRSKDSAEKAIDMAKYFMDEILTGLAIIEECYKKLGIDGLIKKYKFFKFEDFDEKELNELFSEKEIKEIEEKIDNAKLDLKNNTGDEIHISVNAFSFEMLNKLEYMSMYFSSNVADDAFIYDSIHQSFLNSVQLLYISIAKRNITEKDKYYRNVIKIYNKWKNRYLREQEKEERINAKIEKQQKKIKNIKKKMGINKKVN